MTNEEAIKILTESRNMLIKANEIYHNPDFEKAKQAYDLAIKALKNERQQGEWTEDDTPAGTWIPEEETYTDLSGTIETYTRFNCDRCMQGQNFGPYPFCPWCGAKMNPEIREEDHK